MTTPHQLARPLALRVALLAVATCSAATLARGQSPSALTPADAAQKVGTTCSVEFIVKSVGLSKSGEWFLNSEMNFQWAGNFAAVVPGGDAARYPKAGGAKGFEQYFNGKLVRVTGKVEKLKNTVGIRAAGPGQLVVVNANPERDPIEVPPPPGLTPDDQDLRPPSYLRYYLIAGGVVLLGVWYALARKKKLKEDDS